MRQTDFHGAIAESFIIADIVRRGYIVSLPTTHYSRYDLIADRNGKLERVQCKYAKSENGIVLVKCYASPGGNGRYTANQVDWIAAYDDSTGRCFYVPSSFLGVNGRTMISLRLKNTTRRFKAGFVHWADDFSTF